MPVRPCFFACSGLMLTRGVILLFRHGNIFPVQVLGAAKASSVLLPAHAHASVQYLPGRHGAAFASVSGRGRSVAVARFARTVSLPAALAISIECKAFGYA